MITKEKLIDAGPERLSEILLSLYQNNRDIQKQLNIAFAGLDNDPKKVISLLKKEIMSLKRSTRFIDYYESNTFSDNLDQLRLRITEDLMPKSAEDAAVLMLSFLDLHKSVLNRVDDSNGFIGSVFKTAGKNLGQIYPRLSKPTEEVVDLIFNCFMKDNDYGIYDDIIYDFKEALKDQGFVLLKQRIEGALNPKNSITVKYGLLVIADCQANVEAYIKACNLIGRPSAYDHLEIANRLIKDWRSTEALEWLNQANIAKEHSWYNDLTKLKIEALELNGEYTKAEKERIEWFNRSLSSKVYGQILSHANHKYKEEFKKEAIEIAFNFIEPHTSITFLKEAQEFEECAKFVYLRIDELDGGQYYTLRPVADILKSVDLLAATLLYRKMIEPVLELAKSKYYNYAAKDLITCLILSSQIVNWGRGLSHSDYFVQLKEKHKRNVSFWEEYKIALDKQIRKEAKYTKIKEG